MGLSDLRRDMGFTVTTPEDLAAESPIEALLDKVMNLETAKSPQTKRPKRHQPLTLLWALGRAARAEPRLVSWETTRAEIGSLISTFGLVDDAPNPEYPVLKLTHFGLWEMAGHPAPPAASGGEPLRWMRRHQPLSGPRDWVYDLVAKDDVTRSRVAAFLLSEYLHDVDQNTLLARVGLQAAPVGRRSTTVERIVRDTALSRLVKTLHGHMCQICGIGLMLPTGPYAEGCHIRPLGEPRKEADCYTHPPELHDELTAALGDFPLFSYWGPGAGIASSTWICRATQHVMTVHNPGRERPGLTVANVCWWYAMGADVDWTVTPRPIYYADGRTPAAPLLRHDHGPHPPHTFRTVMCTGSAGDERFSDGRARTKQAGASTRWLTGM